MTLFVETNLFKNLCVIEFCDIKTGARPSQPNRTKMKSNTILKSWNSKPKSLIIDPIESLVGKFPDPSYDELYDGSEIDSSSSFSSANFSEYPTDHTCRQNPYYSSTMNFLSNSMLSSDQNVAMNSGNKDTFNGNNPLIGNLKDIDTISIGNSDISEMSLGSKIQQVAKQQRQDNMYASKSVENIESWKLSERYDDLPIKNMTYSDDDVRKLLQSNNFLLQKIVPNVSKPSTGHGNDYKTYLFDQMNKLSNKNDCPNIKNASDSDCSVSSNSEHQLSETEVTPPSSPTLLFEKVGNFPVPCNLSSPDNILEDIKEESSEEDQISSKYGYNCIPDDKISKSLQFGRINNFFDKIYPAPESSKSCESNNSNSDNMCADLPPRLDFLNTKRSIEQSITNVMNKRRELESESAMSREDRNGSICDNGSLNPRLDSNVPEITDREVCQNMCENIIENIEKMSLLLKTKNIEG